MRYVPAALAALALLALALTTELAARGCLFFFAQPPPT